MYLNKLSGEQKNLFLDLCIHAAMANNVLADEEKALIDQYCDEMDISSPRYSAETSVEDVRAKLAEISSEPEKRIIVLEIAALMLADNEHDESEKAFMRELTQSLGITDDEYDKILDFVGKIIGLYSEINEFVFNRD